MRLRGDHFVARSGHRSEPQSTGPGRADRPVDVPEIHLPAALTICAGFLAVFAGRAPAMGVTGVTGGRGISREHGDDGARMRTDAGPALPPRVPCAPCSPCATVASAHPVIMVVGA